jgi:FixJ family two-component response regulator
MRLEKLTSRERQVMSFMIDGKPSKIVAAALHISPKTVDVHRSHVLEKMGVGSVAELVKLAMNVQTRGVC